MTAPPGAPARRAFWKGKRRSPALIAVLLALATAAVYWSVANHGFVDYDDSDYVSANAHVQSGLSWANAAWAFTTGHASNWHPLTWLSHMLDWQLFGNRPGAFHLVNLAFHVANTLLLFFVLKRMSGALWRSALVAALFALHPLHVESVAWISERKDVLSTLFFLLTLAAYVRYAQAGHALGCSNAQVTGEKPKLRDRKSARREGPQPAQPVSAQQPQPAATPHAPLYYSLALLCFALGLMSKPMLVTLPFVLLLLDYWPLQRFNASTLQRAVPPTLQSSTPPTLRLVVEKLPFFALSLASSVVTFLVQQKGGAVSSSLSLGERIANALVSYVRYIGKMLWPENLSVLYPHPGHWPVWAVVACAALLLAISIGVILLARKHPCLAVGWLWFIGAMIPVIGLVQVGIQSMADRYTYVPIIGLFVMLVWGIGEAVPPRPWRAPLLSSASLLALGACSWLTVRQVQYWWDSEALFRHAVVATTKNYLAYNNLGFYLSNHGRIDEAMANYRKSLAINPNYEDALNNLGHALAGKKKYTEAIPLYEAALRTRPNHVEVNNNLGNALSEIGRIDDAIARYRIALKQNPDHADAHNNLGIALAMQGKLDEAITNFHDAIRLKPNYASAHSNLGNALAVQHKLADAIREFQESLRLDPNDAQAHNNLGNALAEQGKAGAATQQYLEALRLNADNPEAHCNLGLALLRQGKRQEAASHFKEALRLKPDYAEARRQLERLSPQGGPPP